MNEITIGIDLGTTNTLVGYMKQGKPQLFKFPGGSLLPSVIYVEDDDSITVGKTAKKKIINDGDNGIRSAKTYMGDSKKKWICRGRVFTPTAVATEVLREVKRVVLKKMKLEESDTTINAVITVPAYFNSNQNDETKEAGKKAGLNVMRIITEPMAAAVYAIRELNDAKKILVFDLGGGTFDLSLLEADTAKGEYNAIGKGGDKKLGGDDFDALLLEYFKEAVKDDIGVDLSDQKTSGLEYNEYISAINVLRNEAEDAKIALSSQDETEIDVANLFNYKGKGYTFSLVITRSDFNEYCQPLFKRIFYELDRFLLEIQNVNHVALKDIGYVVLAGGSCAIPYICDEIQRRINLPLNDELDKERLVVNGACMIADNEAKGINIINDTVSHSLGVEDYRNGHSELSKIIPAGTKYPCSMTKTYSTTRDNQDCVEINIYEAGQGKENEVEITETNHDLYGSMVLSGIQKAKAGVPQIDVTFSYDKSCCLTVVAEDMVTHTRKEVKITKGTAVKIAGKSQKPMDIVVMLDSSRSMNNYSAIDEAKKACKYLVSDLVDLSVHRLGLIRFNDTPCVLSSLSQNKEKLRNCIDNILASGGTYVIPALETACSMFKSGGNARTVIIVTDGNPLDAPYNYVDKCLKSGIRIIAIGAGRGINDNQLQKLAGKGDCYHIDNMAELKNIFETVINKIMEVK